MELLGKHILKGTGLYSVESSQLQGTEITDMKFVPFDS